VLSHSATGWLLASACGRCSPTSNNPWSETTNGAMNCPDELSHSAANYISHSAGAGCWFTNPKPSTETTERATEGSDTRSHSAVEDLVEKGDVDS
jgi:hypothetical protein